MERASPRRGRSDGVLNLRSAGRVRAGADPGADHGRRHRPALLPSSAYWPGLTTARRRDVRVSGEQRYWI